MSEALAFKPESTISERERQLRYDLETQFAELVNGNMRTDFELRFNGHDLVGEDGRGMEEITATACRDANELAKKDPNLWFEIRRRSLERDELFELIEMAQGKRPNTMVVVSDFPTELMQAKEDVGGYNVSRKQTMLRVLVRKPDGNVHMYSQSLDGSNRQALEAIYARFGIQPEPGELLGQRINVDIPWSEQSVLVDELMGVYDRSLSDQFGGDWHGGRRPADYRNTYEFVCGQQDLIAECIRLNKHGWLNDEVMYKMAATMQKRFETYAEELGIVSPIMMNSNPRLLYQEIELAAAQARAAGMAFSACGATLRADGPDGSTENSLEQAGYGNKSEDGDCEFMSKECPLCHAKNVKTMVKKLSSGKKHISGSCGCSKIA
jgi:hypothetical protein